MLSPFIELPKSKKRQWRDIEPENNSKIVMPQVLGNDLLIVSEAIKIIEDWGYNKVNLNFGCPYPMITNKGLGSRMLEDANNLLTFVEGVLSKINISLSIKMRIGFNDRDSIHYLIEKLNSFNLDFIAIHGRIAKDMYKGISDYELIENLKIISKNKIVYNGDIDSVEHDSVVRGFPNLMIGRGLIKNPFLAQEIKQIFLLEKEKKGVLEVFYNELLNEYSKKWNDEKQVVLKLWEFWKYHSEYYGDIRIAKKVKKCRRVGDYKNLIKAIIK